MALNKNDSSRVSYKARIEWYKERFADIVAGKPVEKKTADEEFEVRTFTPDELIGVLDDLARKASKLNKRIDDISMAMSIPIDPKKEPDISQAVKELDEDSKGEFLSYSLYLRLLEQQKTATDNLDINDVINNESSDPLSSSLFIQDRLAAGLAQYGNIESPSVPKDNSLERYVNRYMNNIFSWNEHDYKTRQILNFADNYLGTFPDPAYIPWTAKKDVYYEVGKIKDLSSFWKYFSDGFTDRANTLIGGLKGLTALRPDPAIHDLTKKTIDYTNKFLNGVNNILESGWGVDIICCFVSWGGSLDLKTLKGLRALLQLFKSGLTLDITDIINSIKDIINNIFRGLLTHHLVALVHQIFQRLVDPIKKWIANPDPLWQKVFACTPVDELINGYIIASIDQVEASLVKLIQNWYKQIEIENLDFELKTSLWGEQKEIGEFIKLLDNIIAALERSAICGTGSSPTGEEIQRLMSAYGLGPSKPYQYTEEENPNMYNSFIPAGSQVSGEALSQPTTTKFQPSITAGGIGDDKTSKVEDCFKKITPENVVQVTEWFEDIKAKSSRRI